VNPQELFLDVSSGRFLDGVSAIPSTNPKIFSREQKRYRIGLYKVKSGTVSAVTPSDNATFKARIGTSALKLADGVSVSTAQPNLITALGSVVTASSLQAIGSARITTYSPITATLIANMTTFPVITAGFSTSINYVAPVTASITVGIGTITVPGNTVAVPANLSGVTDLLKPVIFGRVLSLTATLNTPVTATFAATINNGSVSDIAKLTSGLGFLDGSYKLTIATPSPVQAQFTATISSGTVTTISIDSAGSGYGQGPFNLIIEQSPIGSASAVAYSSPTNGSIYQISITTGGSGYPTAPSVILERPKAQVAEAQAIAIGGQIQSITITTGGFGYTTRPSVVLSIPLKSIIAVEPSNKINNVTSGSTFKWAYGLASSATVGLSFSPPDDSTAVTPTSVTPTSVPSAFIYWQGDNTWKLQLISGGYGYTTAPTVIHNTAFVSDNYFNQQARIVSTRGTTTLTSGTPQLATIANHPPVQSDLANTIVYSTIQDIGINLRQTGRGIYISSGGVALDYPQNLYNTDIYSEVRGQARSPQWYAPYQYFQYQQNVQGRTNLLFSPQTAAIYTLVNTFSLAQAKIAKYSPLILPDPNKPELVVAPIELNHLAFAGKDFIAALIPQTPEQPTQYAVCRITIPATTSGYLFWQNGLAPESKVYESGWYSQAGGGALEPKITWIDYGSGYTSEMCSGGFKLREISNLLTGSDFIESPGDRSVVAVTSFLEGGYANNIFASPASASTRPGAQGVKYFLSNGGFGYYKSSVISIPAYGIAGGVITASVINSPTNYIDGTYACSVASAPGAVTNAKISLVVSNGNYSAVIVQPGLDYSSAPVVTAPNPNFISGSLSNISVVTRPEGYSLNKIHNINISQSPISGGTAQAVFSLDNNKQISVNIINPGFGYTTKPTAVGNDPDLREQNGYINSIQLSNQPVGYDIGRAYPLTIQQSPSTYGTANAIFTRIDSSRYEVTIISRGYGYTSAPTVLAASPDQLQGTVNYVSVTTRGRGYSPGTYQCSVTSAPAGGETAQVSFVVTDNKNATFITDSPGYGYVSAPQVSVPTPNGNVLSSITITCSGSYYTPSTATFSILDDSGSGATFKVVISSGTINGVQVVSAGYGYTNNPAILFSSPAATTYSDLATNQIEADFNITTASANAILATATQKDVLMEVYETDGTNEQVIAQATVNLAKRVLE